MPIMSSTLMIGVRVGAVVGAGAGVGAGAAVELGTTVWARATAAAGATVWAGVAAAAGAWGGGATSWPLSGARQPTTDASRTVRIKARITSRRAAYASLARDQQR